MKKRGKKGLAMLKRGGRGTTSFAIVLTQALEYLAMMRG